MARNSTPSARTLRRWRAAARDEAAREARKRFPGRSRASREARATFVERSARARVGARRKTFDRRAPKPDRPPSTERNVGRFPGFAFLGVVAPRPAEAPPPPARDWSEPRRIPVGTAPPEVLVDVSAEEYREGFYRLSRACEDEIRPSGRNGTVYVFQFREENGEFRRRRRWQVSRWLDFILGSGETYRASRSQVWTEGGFFLGFADGQQFSPPEADRWECPLPEFVFEYHEE